jgi:hypothetical protein
MRRMSRLIALGSLLAVACMSGEPTGPTEPSSPGDGPPDASGEPAACGSDPSRLDLNDVSFLFPLPESNLDIDDLLPLDARGARGRLLPISVFAQMPPLVGLSPILPQGLRVVSARFDPCADAAAAAPSCRPQIRLVAQPLFIVPLQPPITIDATVHLFYDLDDDDLAAVIDAVRDLKAMAGDATACQPLGPHPVMVEQGLRGQYANRLIAMILAACGEQTLSRVAVMQLVTQGLLWRFATLDITGDETFPFEIPRLDGATAQTFTRSLTEDARATFGPEPTGSNVPLLLKPSELVAAAADDARSAVEESFLLDNPALSHAGELDCVSCHVSSRSRDVALVTRPMDVPESSPIFVDPEFDMSLPADALGLRSQRMFGYFDRTPSLSPRVVHESAQVARSLDELGP